MKKLSHSQIKRYDINQKLIQELTDLQSRLIIFSIITHAQSIAYISRITKIPLSTVYQKLKNLEEISLVFVEKNVLEEGHKIKYYKSRVKGIEISISKHEPKIILIKNKI
ncbi:hypothetical protein [Candidatus Nitrosopumilus sediminis]|uniref:Transcriptional regulator n=1 Tax=Candidatus Nitrosopumilus sediminis TaxID=1229909 RepID=K0B9W4_9ARCH|nr:hypothetical protein [Candidatus Nitrosopumilus sediminis]AFS82988.1 transcriptional regulator [Candidatus Nitrosopumilus sediminis]